MMSKKYYLLLPLIVLSSCAYTFDESYQEVEVRTPGAQDARCNVMANDVLFKFFPPQKRILPKSKEDLVLTCMAPGNRDRTVVIRPSINNKFYGNAASGMAGGAWDYASAAMFSYPDVIDVSFEGMPIKSMQPPAHNNPDIKQPEEYYLEEFRAGSPRMNQDRFRESVPIQRRAAPGSEGDLYDEGFGFASENAENVIEEYDPQYTGGNDSGSIIDDMTVPQQESAEMPATFDTGESNTTRNPVVVIDTQSDITTSNTGNDSSENATSDGMDMPSSDTNSNSDGSAEGTLNIETLPVE